MKRPLWILAGLALAVTAGVLAQTGGGFPSFPNFLGVTLNSGGGTRTPALQCTACTNSHPMLVSSPGGMMINTGAAVSNPALVSGQLSLVGPQWGETLSMFAGDLHFYVDNTATADSTFFMQNAGTAAGVRSQIVIGDATTMGAFGCNGVNWNTNNPDFSGGPPAVNGTNIAGGCDFGSWNGMLVFGANSVYAGYIDKTTQSWVFGNPTGGAMGSGTLNAANLFINGVPVTQSTTVSHQWVAADHCSATGGTFTLDLRLTGQIVAMNVQTAASCTTGAGNNTLTAAGIIPAAYRPAHLQNIECPAENGGSQVAGETSVNVNGDYTVAPLVGGGATPMGNLNFTCTYSLD